MASANEKEISVEQFKWVVKNYWNYFLLNWKWIILASLLAALCGFMYAFLQKPKYIAEITFVAESENSSPLGSYAGLAAQFGIDAGSSNGAFEGENLIELMRSNLMIEKALLSPIDNERNKNLLINYYIREKGYEEQWKKKPSLQAVRFNGFDDPPNRVRDSILKSITKEILKNALSIDKVDKKLDYVAVKMEDSDELFAKSFIEQLVNKVIEYYVSYKSQKSRQNVEILSRQVDSVHKLLSGDIVNIATSNDLNVNPLKQVMRAGVQRRQVDVQVNSALYAELIKNLELSKIALRKQTPLIQIIDTPKYPLEKKKLGILIGSVVFAIAGGFLALFFFFMKKLLQL